MKDNKLIAEYIGDDAIYEWWSDGSIYRCFHDNDDDDWSYYNKTPDPQWSRVKFKDLPAIAQQKLTESKETGERIAETG